MQPTRQLAGHNRPVGALIQGPVAPGPGPSSPVLFSGGDDYSIRLWDMSSGGPVGTLRGHRSAVRALAASEVDGSVWSGSFHGEIRQWQGQACGAILHANRATKVKEGRHTYHSAHGDSSYDRTSFQFCDSSVVGLVAVPEGELYSASKCGAVRRWVEGSDSFYESLEWHNRTDAGPSSYPTGFSTCRQSEPGLTSMIYLANDPAHIRGGKLLVGLQSYSSMYYPPCRAWELPEADGLTHESYRPWWLSESTYSQRHVWCFAGSNITEFYMGDSRGDIDKCVGSNIVATFRGHRIGRSDGVYVRVLGLSRDGATLFSGGSDGTLKVWSTESGMCVNTVVAHRGPVLALVVLQDGSGTVFSSGREGVIKEWRFV